MNTREKYIKSKLPGAPDAQIEEVMKRLGLKHYAYATMDDGKEPLKPSSLVNPKAKAEAMGLTGTTPKAAEAPKASEPKKTTPLMLQNQESSGPKSIFSPRKKDPNQNPLIVR